MSNINKLMGGKTLKISNLDLTTLLYNIQQGSQEKDIGWEDASLSLNSIMRFLKGNSYITLDHVESALWSCNLRDEKGRFWDIKGRDFDQFVRSLLPQEKFNRQYNFFQMGE